MKKIWEQMTQKNWCKGALARKRSLFATHAHDPEAIKWCAMGWIDKVYGAGEEIELMRGSKKRLAIQKLYALISEEDPVSDVSWLEQDRAIEEWNDHWSMTWEQVRDMFKEVDL